MNSFCHPHQLRQASVKRPCACQSKTGTLLRSSSGLGTDDRASVVVTSVFGSVRLRVRNSNPVDHVPSSLRIADRPLGAGAGAGAGVRNEEAWRVEGGWEIGEDEARGGQGKAGQSRGATYVRLRTLFTAFSRSSTIGLY